MRRIGFDPETSSTYTKVLTTRLIKLYLLLLSQSIILINEIFSYPGHSPGLITSFHLRGAKEGRRLEDLTGNFVVYSIIVFITTQAKNNGVIINP